AWEGDILAAESLASGEGELGSLPENPQLSEWVTWLKNVDRQGTSIDRYMADASRYAFTFGHVYIVVDMPRVDQTIFTEEDRARLGIRPYLTTYFPTEMTDWGLDDNGQLAWCRFREPLREKQDPFAPRPSAPISGSTQGSHIIGRLGQSPDMTTSATIAKADGVYRTWTTSEWFIHEVKNQKVALLAQGTHPVGAVPVATLYNKRHSTYPFFGA